MSAFTAFSGPTNHQNIGIIPYIYPFRAFLADFRHFVQDPGHFVQNPDKCKKTVPKTEFFYPDSLLCKDNRKKTHFLPKKPKNRDF